MSQLIDRVKRSRKIFGALFIIYLVLNGIWLFPIRLGLTLENWGLNLLVIAVLWVLGLVMVGLYPEKPDRGIMMAFMLNGAGLVLRMAAELGNESFASLMTTHNVSLYLVVIPVVLYFSYIYHRKKYLAQKD